MSDLQHVRAEVEYVRTATIEFVFDPNSGMSEATAKSQAVARFSRALNFYMHSGKSLVLGEKPRLVRWRFFDPEIEAEQEALMQELRNGRVD